MPEPAPEFGVSVFVLGLLLLAASLACVLLVWQLLRSWRRRDLRKDRPPQRSSAANLWQASGDRLVARMNQSKPWDRSDGSQDD